MLQDGSKNDREVNNSDDAASANQKRMNADPLEVMLLNMGYRITGFLDVDEDENSGDNPTCRTTWRLACGQWTNVWTQRSLPKYYVLSHLSSFPAGRRASSQMHWTAVPGDFSLGNLEFVKVAADGLINFLI